MTQPHMGRPRPLERLLTTNRLSRGISGFAKVDTGAAGGPGHGGTPWPGPAREAPEKRGSLTAEAGVPPGPPSSSTPFHVGPQAAGHMGGREPGRAWAQRLGVALARPAAPTCPLPGPEAPTSSWAPATAASAFPGPGVRRGPAPGGTCAPQIRIREKGPAPGPRGGRGCGARGGGPLCWNSKRLCPYEKQSISYTLKTTFLPAAWISPGYL